MASVAEMMEAECGPSNPLAGLARHLTEDLSRQEEIAGHGVAGAEASAGLSRPFPLHPAVIFCVCPSLIERCFPFVFQPRSNDRRRFSAEERADEI